MKTNTLTPDHFREMDACWREADDPAVGGIPLYDNRLGTRSPSRFARSAKWLFDFYLFGNVHMALCAVALTLTTQAIFRLNLRIELIVFVFCGTFFGYNLQRLPSAFQCDSVHGGCRRHRWNTRHRLLLTALSVLAAIAFAWSGSRLYLRSQLMALIPAALSFAYAFPIIRTKQKWIQLREIPGIKIFVIAITWACSCALLPIVSVHHEGGPWFSPAAVLWAFVCGLLVLSLTVPFDIRDLPYDVAAMKTLPALLGARKSILVAIGALIVSAVGFWIIWRYMGTGTGRLALAYSAWCAIASFFVYKSSPERHEYYFSFVIDGLLLLLWALVWTAGAM